jgi:ankyrin repeat protein
MLQDGDTALHWAAAGGRPEVINLLVKHGAAVDIRNKVYKAIAAIFIAQTEHMYIRGGTERVLIV